MPGSYRRGARFPTGLLFWRVFAELRKYREFTSAAGKPLTVYYAGFILTWFTLFLALGLAARFSGSRRMWDLLAPTEFAGGGLGLAARVRSLLFCAQP